MTALLRAFEGTKDAELDVERRAAPIDAERPSPEPTPTRRSWPWVVAALFILLLGIGLGSLVHRARADVLVTTASATTVEAPPIASTVPSSSAIVAAPDPIPSGSTSATSSSHAAPRGSTPHTSKPGTEAKSCICSGSRGRLCALDADWSLLRCSCVAGSGYVSTDPGRSGWDFDAKGSPEGQTCKGFASNGQPAEGKLVMCAPVCSSVAFAGIHRDHCRGRVPGTGEISEGTLYCY